jgi:hypothetical protein
MVDEVRAQYDTEFAAITAVAHWPPLAVTACPAAMLPAAFTSALPVYPQDRQRKTAWLSRACRCTIPHAEQR